MNLVVKNFEFWIFIIFLGIENGFF
jgi:hypothetical protein